MFDSRISRENKIFFCQILKKVLRDNDYICILECVMSGDIVTDFLNFKVHEKGSAKCKKISAQTPYQKTTYG